MCVCVFRIMEQSRLAKGELERSLYHMERKKKPVHTTRVSHSHTPAHCIDFALHLSSFHLFTVGFLFVRFLFRRSRLPLQRALCGDLRENSSRKDTRITRGQLGRGGARTRSPTRTRTASANQTARQRCNIDVN